MTPGWGETRSEAALPVGEVGGEPALGLLRCQREPLCSVCVGLETLRSALGSAGDVRLVGDDAGEVDCFGEPVVVVGLQQLRSPGLG